ncbi:hypothetical protein OS188_14500 [Xanthomarina sp. F1114]|uniref:hypothetical protein n=1 Tax=Xanthomarina sp. F1114 TaxID=2996019 RepID=UPI00225E28CE|nr:hypothetical protein [Xanthomarina sp. F1114]MCX7549164.1 hypothetical protein [Xanthomarina sp. F1114]
MKEVEIEVYDKREKVTTTLCVKQLTENQFRMIDNDLFNNELTLGAEFETKINSENKHEVVKILKKSEFITRRFSLTPNYKESDYRILGDELTKRGGFWQVDLGSIATVNIPKSFEFDINQVIKDLELVEITD